MGRLIRNEVTEINGAVYYEKSLIFFVVVLNLMKN